MTNMVLEQLTKRRSIYVLGKNIHKSADEVATLIQETVEASPSAFNSQSSRVVVLMGEHQDKVWEIAKGILRAMIPADSFAATEQKMDMFKAAFGTVLFFEDVNVVKGLQEQFAAYADNFPIWSEHSSAMAQLAVWTVLSSEGIGASLQHYNPIIDEQVKAEWGIPANWVLRAQMPFGSIEAPANDKDTMARADRFKVFK